MKPRSTKRAKFKLRKSQIRRIGNLEVLKEPNSNFVQLLLAVTGLALSHQARDGERERNRERKRREERAAQKLVF